MTFFFRFIFTQITLLFVLYFLKASLRIVSALRELTTFKYIAFAQGKSFRKYVYDQVNKSCYDEKRQKEDAN